MSFAVSYTGRTYDVAAFRGQQAVGAIVLDESLASTGDSGAVLTGVLKVAQWFVVELLTAAGSFPDDSTRGTNFVPSLMAGQIQTDTDLYVAFGFAVGTIKALAKQLQTAATPPDEQFTGATLTSATIVPGAVQLSITLLTAAGTSRAILLPLATIF